MPRGVRKHLKRLNAPSHWMLNKLGGTWAPKPTSGPHKLRECLPLIVLLRNRLKYALTKKEVVTIVKQRLIKVDGKVRTDSNFPAGFMDVVHIPKTSEHFRLLWNVKGRFMIHPISDIEAKYKLCQVRKVQVGAKGVPVIVTHDGRTIRYPDPLIKQHDVVKYDLETGKITDFIKFEVGNLCMITGGRNRGRVGIIENRERHPGGFDIVHVKDSVGNNIATRLSNVFIIGKGTKSLVTLPKRKGVKLSILEEKERKNQAAALETA